MAGLTTFLGRRCPLALLTCKTQFLYKRVDGRASIVIDDPIAETRRKDSRRFPTLIGNESLHNRLSSEPTR